MQNEQIKSRHIFDAILNGDTGFVTDCLHNFKNVFLEKGWVTWLESAAAAGHLSIIVALVKSGADINEPHSNDSTKSPEGVIDLASAEGHLEVVRWLLDHGARINHVKDGRTRCFALVGAAGSGHLEVVKLLIERGAAVNSSWAGMTPLDHAYTYGQQEVGEYLRSIGAKTAAELG